MTHAVYLFDPQTADLAGVYLAQESPEEPGIYITPTHSTTTPPPVFDPAAFTCRFDGAAWVLLAIPAPADPVPPTVPELQSAKWDEMKQARATAISQPIATPYGVFDADDGSRTSITDAVLLLQSLEYVGAPGTVAFTLADNTVVTLDTAKMIEVGLLLGQQVQAAYARSRVVRAEIDAATTAAQVETVVW